MLAYMLQDVWKYYKSRKWILLFEQQLRFQEAAGDSSAITLHVAKPSFEQAKWMIVPITEPKV